MVPHDANTGTGAAPTQENEARADRVLEQIDRLPTLSPVATRLLGISSADDTDIDEIVRLLESDPALSAMMLGLCRRADRGLGDRISTVRHAVVMLGIEAVRSAVLSVHVYDVLRAADHPDADNGGIDRAGLWKHALGVACASELIARSNPKRGVSPDTAFCCGLLHDLGRIALDAVLPKAMARVASVAERRACDAAPIEREVLGLDHHAAGRRLAERWGLPANIRDVIWMHSQPVAALPESVDRDAIAVVTLGRLWARQMHLGWSGDFGRAGDPAQAARDAGIDADVFDTRSRDLVEEFAARCALLGLDTRSEPELLVDAIMRANRALGRLNRDLEDRAERSGKHAAVLDAIAAFCTSETPGESVRCALLRIARSAQSLLGEGYCAAIVQGTPGSAWELVRFSEDPRSVASTAVTPPVGMDLTSDMFARDTRGMPALAQMDWLAPALSEAPRATRVRMWPLLGCARGSSPGVMLLHDREHPRGDTSAWDAVSAVWASAVLGAWRQERARELGDQLATANRALAEAQAEFAERESMVRLGEMTAGAAHEMNNPLAVIRGRSQLLAMRLEKESDKSAAHAIAQAAASLSDMITRLHLLARPATPNIGACNAAEITRRAEEIARERLGSARPLEARIDIPPGLPCASADPELVAQAAAEGIVNASEATDGGIVRIDVQPAPGEFRLELRIRDDGPGLSDKALRHAFDPFFSEHAAGRRPGLGLARARRLVEVCGGRVWIENARGGGAVLTLSLEIDAAGDASRAA